MRTEIIEKKIYLTAGQVRDFVECATKCDFDIDVFYNHYEVDAKSILGVYALDLTKQLTVRMHGYNPEFMAYLNSCTLAS